MYVQMAAASSRGNESGRKHAAEVCKTNGQDAICPTFRLQR